MATVFIIQHLTTTKASSFFAFLFFDPSPDLIVGRFSRGRFHFFRLRRCHWIEPLNFEYTPEERLEESKEGTIALSRVLKIQNQTINKTNKRVFEAQRFRRTTFILRPCSLKELSITWMTLPTILVDLMRRDTDGPNCSPGNWRLTLFLSKTGMLSVVVVIVVRGRDVVLRMVVDGDGDPFWNIIISFFSENCMRIFDIVIHFGKGDVFDLSSVDKYIGAVRRVVWVFEFSRSRNLYVLVFYVWFWIKNRYLEHKNGVLKQFCCINFVNVLILLYMYKSKITW